jgi:MoaA/NifB/PqqE/SkfB family radical SAM enzyme
MAGGEPFLHPFIFQLIAAAKQAGLTTSVVTNGSCLTADKLLRLKVSMNYP